MKNKRTLSLSNAQPGHMIETKDRGRTGYLLITDIYYYPGGSVVSELEGLTILKKSQARGNQMRALTSADLEMSALPSLQADQWCFELETQRVSATPDLLGTKQGHVVQVGDIGSTINFNTLKNFTEDEADDVGALGPSGIRGGSSVFNQGATGRVVGGGYDPDFDARPKRFVPADAEIGYTIDIQLEDARDYLGLDSDLVALFTKPSDPDTTPPRFHVGETARFAGKHPDLFARYFPDGSQQADMDLDTAFETGFVEMPFLPVALQGLNEDGSTPTLLQAFDRFKSPKDLPKGTPAASMIIDDLSDAAKAFQEAAAAIMPREEAAKFARTALKTCFDLFVKTYMDNPNDPRLKRADGSSIVSRSPDPSVRKKRRRTRTPK